MRDLSPPVFPFCLSAVSDAIVIKIDLIFAVTAWIDAEGDGIHFTLRIELSNVLFQFAFWDNCSLSDVNGTVVSTWVVPWGVEVKLDPSIHSSIKRHLVVCEAVPLASRWEVYGTTLLT